MAEREEREGSSVEVSCLGLRETQLGRYSRQNCPELLLGIHCIHEMDEMNRWFLLFL
jgi:hypothetical protein